MRKEFLSKIIDIIYRIVLILIMVIGTIMLAIALAHIFSRYVLNSALTWSEELLKILMVWFSLLSTTVISRKSQHIGIVVFRHMMPIEIQKKLLVTVRLLILIACVIVSIVGINFIVRAIGQYTPSLNIPYSVAYAAIPVNFIIMTIYEIYHIINKDFMDDTNSAESIENV